MNLLFNLSVHLFCNEIMILKTLLLNNRLPLHPIDLSLTRWVPPLIPSSVPLSASYMLHVLLHPVFHSMLHSV